MDRPSKEQVDAHAKYDATKERCTCGHTRLVHISSFARCVYHRCKCARFTWDTTSEENDQLLRGET